MSTWKEEEVEDKLSTLYSKLLCAIRNGLDHFLSLAPKSCGQQLLRKGGSSNAAKLAVETYFDCLLYGITNNYKKKVKWLLVSVVFCYLNSFDAERIWASFAIWKWDTFSDHHSKLGVEFKLLFLLKTEHEFVKFSNASGFWVPVFWNLNTVFIRKPDRSRFEWSSLGRFLGPTFGRLDWTVFIYIYIYLTV